MYFSKLFSFDFCLPYDATMIPVTESLDFLIGERNPEPEFSNFANRNFDGNNGAPSNHFRGIFTCVCFLIQSVKQIKF